jgi:nitrite reductase/ring-hydroxylating ferredoxin subunit
MPDQDDIALIRLCDSDAVGPGTALAVNAPGVVEPLAVYRLAGGEVYVTDDTCTHAAASLADGFIDGDEIECPLHAGRFCIRDGRATEEPCEEPLRTYEAVEQDGGIFIRAPK